MYVLGNSVNNPQNLMKWMKHMAHTRRFSAFVFSAIVVLCGTWAFAQSGDPDVLQQKLNAQFKLTTTTADRTDIVTAGDIVQIHKPGLIMFSVDERLPPTSVYKDGKLGQGFGTVMLISKNTVQRRFVPEEKCWVTRVTVLNDSVLFDLYSDPYQDVRYYGKVKIPFPDKKAIPPVDSFLQTIAEVLTVVPQDNEGAQQQAPAPPAGPVMNAAGADQQAGIAGEYTAPGGSRLVLLSDGTFTKFVGDGQGQGNYSANGHTLVLRFSIGSAQGFMIRDGNLLDVRTRQVWTRTGDAPAPAPAPAPTPASAPAPLQAIAPPPPPADAPPPTVAVGQTVLQVTAAFGQPTRIAEVGTKEIYYYKDMKVTFTSGKVSNVE